MDDLKVKQGGRNATKLVWTITLLGLGAGIFMLGIVYWTIGEIHSEREKLDAFQAALTHMVKTLDTYLEQGRNDIEQLLSKEQHNPGNDQWIKNLTELTSGAELSIVTGNSDIRLALNQLGKRVSDLKKLHIDSLAWRTQTEQLGTVLHAVRQKVEKSLNRLGGAIISIEGRQRLQRAILSSNIW